jgi:hypothetical protein
LYQQNNPRHDAGSKKGHTKDNSGMVFFMQIDVKRIGGIFIDFSAIRAIIVLMIVTKCC